uniref:Mediator of RNA polymerase II transcription subunit 25 n=1 Tax=Panagrellus redivivus TaxID=6233 RepID=A0A7E4V6J7_PANRE
MVFQISTACGPQNLAANEAITDPFLQLSQALGLPPLSENPLLQKAFAAPIHPVEKSDFERSQAENAEFLKRISAKLPSATKCKENTTDVVIAVSTAPYDAGTLEQNLQLQRNSLRRLEAFTGKRVASFGPYSEEALNVDGHYAYQMTFDTIADCNEAKEFTNKAVSYSRHIERAVVHCKCENYAISKVRKSH